MASKHDLQLVPTAKGKRFLPVPIALAFEDRIDTDQPMVMAILHLLSQEADLLGQGGFSMASLQRELGVPAGAAGRREIEARFDTIACQSFMFRDGASWMRCTFAVADRVRYSRHGATSAWIELNPEIVRMCRESETLAYPWALVRKMDPVSFNLTTLALLGRSTVIERPKGLEPQVFRRLMENTADTLGNRGLIVRAEISDDSVAVQVADSA